MVNIELMFSALAALRTNSRSSPSPGAQLQLSVEEARYGQLQLQQELSSAQEERDQAQRGAALLQASLEELAQVCISHSHSLPLTLTPTPIHISSYLH